MPSGLGSRRMGPFKEQLRATQLFGCWYAVLLGLGIAFIDFVGTVMGDCEPGPGCHDHDAALIGVGLLKAALIAAVFGAVVWLLVAIIRLMIGSRLNAIVANCLLGALVLALLWASFSPAMDLWFALGA